MSPPGRLNHEDRSWQNSKGAPAKAPERPVSATVTRLEVGRHSHGGQRGADGELRDTGASPGRARGAYLTGLIWAFTLFNSLRVFSYLPTLWAIIATADSSQHSLWTWGTWLGANMTMAAWLFEQQGQRFSRAVVVNLGNAAMCAATITVILAVRY
jgi:hypothetical protein